MILVGLQSDLRMNMNYIIDLSRRGLEPVDGKAVRRLAQQLRMEYIECSALTQHNLKEVKKPDLWNSDILHFPSVV